MPLPATVANGGDAMTRQPRRDTNDHTDRATPLRRILGLTEVTAGGVGMIIGAGIYVLLGAATQEAGSLVWLSFVIAAALAGLTGLSYAELSSMFPSAAGEYEYTRHALPHWVAFAVGWTMIVGLVVTAATVSIGFARYLQYFVAIDLRLAAVGLLVTLGGVATIGIKQSARLTVGLSAIQVAGLLLVIVIGLPHLGEVDVLTGPGATGVLGAAALVFFAFIGFDEVITLAEETRDPTRTVPRALLLALGISTLLYVAVAVTAVSVLGPAALAASPRPLADAMGHVLGDHGATVVAAIALMTTMNTALLAVTPASRITYGMAKAGVMPATLAAIHPARATPVRAIVLVTGAAVAFALLGEFRLIAAVTDFTVYVVFLAVNVTVIVLRRTRPEAPRRFRVPWCIAGVPVPPMLGLVSVATMMTHLEPRAMALGVALCGAGLAVGWLRGPRR
jgi:APA family basic amino acid/polyamine antiporter